MEKHAGHVLFLASWLPGPQHPTNGNFILRHAQAVGRQFPVSVLHFSTLPGLKGRPQTLQTEENGVMVIRIYLPETNGQLASIKKLISQWSALIKGYKLATNQFGKPALCHANVVLNAGIWARMLQMRFGISYVITEHWSGYLPQNGRFNGGLKKALTRFALQKASAILPVSQSLAQAMQSHGLHGEYVVVPNVVNTKLFHPSHSPTTSAQFHFLHVSMLANEIKNVKGIIEAFCALPLTASAKLTIIGQRPDEVDIRAFIDQKQNENIEYIGFLPIEQIAAHMQQANCFVLFSQYETLSAVVAEALCCGLPVIASAVGGVPEMVDDTNGIVVQPNNTMQLTEAMQTLMANKLAYNAHQISQAASKRYSEKAVAAAFIKIYKAIVPNFAE